MKRQLINWFSYLYPTAKSWLKAFNGGIFPRYYKELSNQHGIIKTPLPKELVLPLQQHIGIETIPLVSVGDYVKKYQLIADAEAKDLHAPIHAPASGTIKSIETRTVAKPLATTGLCIIIETESDQVIIENFLEVNGNNPNSPSELKDIIYRAGIAGMGGAGFPTFAKIPNQKNKIKHLIINGAECEPFITCDDLLMQTQAKAILTGAMIVAEALSCDQILCGIEDNKQQAIKAMEKAAKSFNSVPIKIKSVLTVYPMGGEKQLIKELLNIEIPSGTHSIDSAILTMNVATLNAIFEAVSKGNPLVSRLVTVSGTGLAKPFNTQALLGTSFISLAQQAQPKTELNYPLIMGGPMMGFKVANNNVPLIKTTNCILAIPPQPVEKTMPCIRCGACMDVCPVNLLPQQLYWHSRSHEFDKVEKLHLSDCIECGCCSFVCPSNIPLVQYYRFAKSEVKKLKEKQKIADHAKLRHENKLAREARLKAEKDARIKAKKAAIKQKALLKAQQKSRQENNQSQTEKVTNKKSTGAAAAAARAAAMRKKKTLAQASTEQAISNSAPVLNAREKAIAAAKQRALKAGQTGGKETDAEKRKRKAQQASTTPKDPAKKAQENAKRRAAEKAANMLKKKQAEQQKTKTEQPDNSKIKTIELAINENLEEKPPMDKKAQAMLAAKKRAAAMKAKKLAAQKAEQETQP
ncbi:MAG TPA: electron transport complex subunit RsxC [Thiomicrospira sp.]|jgi:electron transport complex protein RnfC|nr:electron transport complex subunit RsxC [Thiomicrospira sp.]